MILRRWLHTDQLRLSAWRNEDVTFGVYVIVLPFDIDATGRGVLTAWWRILSPGGEKILNNPEKSVQTYALLKAPAEVAIVCGARTSNT